MTEAGETGGRREMICNICGGWARRLPTHGAHEMCLARRRLGLPTPSLGDQGPDCGGRGSSGTGGVMLDLCLGPASIARAIVAQFPPCGLCGGTGAINRG